MILRHPAVLFDLDGTLVDSARDLISSLRFALARVDPREPPDDDTILMEVGKPLEVILRELDYPHTEADARLFAETYREHFARHLDDSSGLFPHVPELLDALCAAGVRLAVVTTKHQLQAELTVKRFGIADRFAHIRGWCEGRRHKPDPEPFLEAATALEIEPARALVVGDTEQDILAAQAGGMTSVAVTWGFRTLFMLKALRPDFIVSRPTDILHIAVSPA